MNANGHARNGAQRPFSFADLAPDQPGRFAGIQRDYGPGDVERLRGSVLIRHTLAELGAKRLWLLPADDEDESCLVMQDIEGNEFCLD